MSNNAVAAVGIVASVIGFALMVWFWLPQFVNAADFWNFPVW
jgi:hypothetical protein